MTNAWKHLRSLRTLASSRLACFFTPQVLTQATLQPSFKPSTQLVYLQTDSDIELAEEGVLGADFVKPHFVDELFEYDRIVGEEVDAPFPVVVANRPGDDLLHEFTVATADEPMLVH